jgi:hypothetical protein
VTILLGLAGYCIAAGLTIAFAVRTSSRSPKASAAVRLGAYGLLAAEVAYIVSTPACVYLPKTASDSAVERELVSSSDADLFWLEGRSAIGFVWGPRWWFWAGHGMDGGIEFLPPVIFAKLTESKWKLVSSDGRQWPVPTEGLFRSRPLGSQLFLVRSDGSLVNWLSNCVQQLAPGAGKWDCLDKITPSQVQAVGMAPDGSTVELHLDDSSFRASRGRTRRITLVARDQSGGNVPFAVENGR